MPAGDKTGPTGAGPMTGRGMGYCAGYNIPGYANPMPGRRLWGRGGFGFGFGRGFGRGYGYGRYFAPYPYYETPYYPYETPYRPSYSSTQDEKAILAEQAREIENELKAIKERISELEGQPQNEEK